MTPEHFVAKWKAADLKERAAAQSHFNDLCELLDEAKPTDADPKGEWYCFERGATKTTGGEGWADVWKRGCFGWEYKSRGRNLNEAIDQLKRYALALENPPLLIACNLNRFRIVTNWTNAVSATHEFDLDGLFEPENRQKLKWAFDQPEQLRPGLTRRHVTEIAASKFAEIATDLRAKGHDPQLVAHFVNRLVFCMFAEDIGLLPNAMFTRMLKEAQRNPAEFEPLCRSLFDAMKGGGRLGFERVEWFNGGLFDDDVALPLTRPEIEHALDASDMDWSQIDPSIMGTLFERGLDPDKRSQLGAHYTDADKIMKIIEPVIQRQLEAEWHKTRDEIEGLLARGANARSASARTRARNDAEKLYKSFLDRVRSFRVLDPACGSGNFLYLALQTLKDIEHRAGIEAEALGLPREFPRVGPEQLLGIEINPYAAELARVSVWIGEIQWMQRNGFGIARNPILRPLDTIKCRDAILDPDGSEPEWPAADVVIGNPPFLGGKLLIGSLGEDYVYTLFERYEGRVSAEADLVCYWYAKARQQLEAGQCQRVGLVATNSIRGGANRRVLDAIRERSIIFEAWDDEAWVVEGAAVRVSLVCFAPAGEAQWLTVHLDGQVVAEIFSDLTARREGGGVNLTMALRLSENARTSFQGVIKTGAFDIPAEIAREWLQAPLNPNGRPNNDVLRPIANGIDILRRAPERWIVDFPSDFREQDAALYEKPFQWFLEKVKNQRQGKRERGASLRWWIMQRPRIDMRRALDGLSRFLATPRNGRHRVFVWLPEVILPDCQLVVAARDDDTTFGILQSSFHSLWSLRLCTWLGQGNDPRYTHTTTFETYPFPAGLTPNIPANAYASDSRAQRIASAAKRLNEFRENWLNPPDLVKRVPEVVPGYPDRILPKDEEAANELKKRTLTNLYNQRPAWLDNIHKELDAAVAAAYGWPADLSDDQILERLFALNQERAPGHIPPAGTPAAVA
jgi:type II restriction/modification system DNA methylase subunit YeeA